jgi:accessory gene regulator protein AgrB
MKLPLELIVKIFEYNPIERENRQIVLDELIKKQLCIVIMIITVVIIYIHEVMHMKKNLHH